MNKPIKYGGLEYGMTVSMPMKSFDYIIPQMGIAVKSHSSDDKMEMVETTIQKYWDSDENANSYKVKLVPKKEKDLIKYGTETFYSMDLLQLIQKGTFILH